MEGRRILITGGAGCLGSNLIEHWLPQGANICVLDNFATGKREVVPAVKGLTVVEGSVADPGTVGRAFDDFEPQVVIHSAAAYKDPTNWQEDARTNVLGAIHIGQAAERLRIERLINFQTALCYGRPQQVPIPVAHPVGPFTSYGITKTAGEQFLLQTKVPVVSLRLANICGPRLAIGPIPTFYKRLKAGQSCFCTDSVRDFLDMSDFLRLMDNLLSSSPRSGTYNVSTGEGRSIHDVFVAVANYLGTPPPEVPIKPVGADDVATVVLDPAQTERDLGWRARLGFIETIERQLRWYDEFGVSDIHSHLKPS